MKPRTLTYYDYCEIGEFLQKHMDPETPIDAADELMAFLEASDGDYRILNLDQYYVNRFPEEMHSALRELRNACGELLYVHFSW